MVQYLRCVAKSLYDQVLHVNCAQYPVEERRIQRVCATFWKPNIKPAYQHRRLVGPLGRALGSREVLEVPIAW